MELQHFIHEHPLIINEFPGKSMELLERIRFDYFKRMPSCTGCGEAIMGSCVCCRQCSFRLHNSCAKLPHKLQLPIHDKHLLVLQEKTNHDNCTYKCNHCNLVCQHFFYHCTLCNFVLAVKCASSLQFILEVEIHDHPLVLVQGSNSFTCDFCGKKGEDMSCLCALCGIWFHRKCAFLPHMVKHMRHKHPLNLTKSLKTDQSEDRLCQFCVKKLDTNYGIYYCSSCDYAAHLNCAMDKDGTELTFKWESKDKEPIESSTKVGKDKIEIPIKIKHFSHKHDLKLTDELKNYEICDGCIQPIFPPFYMCAPCSFFLHKSCVELPHEKQHPLHNHMLTLKSRRPMLALCDACELFTNGFTYECDTCKFELDVSCSLIPENFTHVGHEHSLILSSATLDENCSACNFEMKIFRCTKGEFTLDFGCATLPLKVKHRQHEHLFSLRYTAEDNSGEYYCDICEEERDSKFWFYYCDECSFPAHPKCIFGEFLNSKYRDCRNIKFGSTYTSDIHQHPLTLARKTMDHASCDKCGKFCNEVAYECATCNSIIQVEGLSDCKTSLMDFTVNGKQLLQMAELERRRNEMAELELRNEMAELERRRNEKAELERRRNEKAELEFRNMMADLERRRNEMAELEPRNERAQLQFRNAMAELQFRKMMVDLERRINEMAELEPRNERAQLELRNEMAELQFRKMMADLERRINEMAELEPRNERAQLELKNEMAELERRRNEMAEFKRRRNEMAELELRNEMAELERRRNEMAELEFRNMMADLERRRNEMAELDPRNERAQLELRNEMAELER